MKENLCDSITQKSSCNDIRGIMKAQVDSSPCDEASKNEKGDSISGKPVGQKSSHHKCVDGMTTGEAGVKNFPWTFGEP